MHHLPAFNIGGFLVLVVPLEESRGSSIGLSAQRVGVEPEVRDDSVIARFLPSFPSTLSAKESILWVRRCMVSMTVRPKSVLPVELWSLWICGFERVVGLWTSPSSNLSDLWSLRQVSIRVARTEQEIRDLWWAWGLDLWKTAVKLVKTASSELEKRPKCQEQLEVLKRSDYGRTPPQWPQRSFWCHYTWKWICNLLLRSCQS